MSETAALAADLEEATGIPGYEKWPEKRSTLYRASRGTVMRD
jgi:hypothetical protein